MYMSKRQCRLRPLSSAKDVLWFIGLKVSEAVPSGIRPVIPHSGNRILISDRPQFALRWLMKISMPIIVRREISPPTARGGDS